jgi:signal transduction histidine kinase
MSLQYVQPVHRVSSLARRHGLDVLIVLAALESALEVGLRRNALDAPSTTLWLSLPAVALVPLPLLGRRRAPFAAPVAVWLLAAALSFVDGRLVVFSFGVYFAGIAAAFLLGSLGDPLQARIGLVITVSSAAIVVSNDPDRSSGELVSVPALFAIAWLAGFALHRRAAQAEEAEQRATEAERARESAARLAVAEERARVARELHDIVAHAVSVMVLQVGAVRHRLADTSGEDAEALRSVERTGRAALVEMRRLLGAMRHDGDDVELGPQPSLEDLASLLADFGRTGLPVELHVDGDRFPLPRAIDLSAYRIVQEGLTNVLKHARATQADVTVRYRPDEVEIEVLDDGEGEATSDGLGHGLIGVRERVTIYGGDMAAGAAPSGGFALRVRLPLDRDRR